MNPDKPVAKGEMKNPIDRDRDMRDDPSRTSTGEHPVGTTAGAVAGAVAAGAAIGTAAGPIGTAVGAAVGAVAGGLMGRGIAEMVDPAAEDQYWRDNWQDRSYVEGGYNYDQDYMPAYRYGVDAFTRYPERRYEDIETDLSAGWKDARGGSRLEWDNARNAARDAWDRLSDKVERAMPGDSDRDGK
ncbi:hypothetical protein [Piscinibacter sp. XHJ-5]|uniref:hypothetical protein n=1 Tax=Piscinibacter sp. XHJ-5 TaxID=3037797 RepID=UPI002452A524|nr:hypothetical protein [Piscinibacter sp. XHJ-5]